MFRTKKMLFCFFKNIMSKFINFGIKNFFMMLTKSCTCIVNKLNIVSWYFVKKNIINKFKLITISIFALIFIKYWCADLLVRASELNTERVYSGSIKYGSGVFQIRVKYEFDVFRFYGFRINPTSLS